jgi:hypothetical protein
LVRATQGFGTEYLDVNARGERLPVPREDDRVKPGLFDLLADIDKFLEQQERKGIEPIGSVEGYEPDITVLPEIKIGIGQSRAPWGVRPSYLRSGRSIRQGGI